MVNKKRMELHEFFLTVLNIYLILCYLTEIIRQYMKTFTL
jgi:hypothetical protein